MSAPFTPAERRVARVLFVVALIGTLWNFFAGVRPPPPPLEVERGAFEPDADIASALYDNALTIVPYEVSPDSPLDLRSAGITELTALPGIGEVLADRIIAWRSLRTGEWRLDDLLEIRGIGPATVDRIRPLVTMPEEGAKDTLESAEKGDPGRGPMRPGRHGEWR
jgi:hypothetical protein